jgi:drug/metabolite transporter (DMT)-like permease
MLLLYKILAALLLLSGIYMVILGGHKNQYQAEVSGLVMLFCSLPLILEVRLTRIERSLRGLEDRAKEQKGNG